MSLGPSAAGRSARHYSPRWLRTVPAVCSLHLHRNPQLGSALARMLQHPGLSPTLTGLTSGVSPPKAQIVQVPCVYRFHHSGLAPSAGPYDFRLPAPSWLLTAGQAMKPLRGCSQTVAAIGLLPWCCDRKSLTKQHPNNAGRPRITPNEAHVASGCGQRSARLFDID